EALTIELTAKSGDDGRLFGSITTKQIAKELEKTHGYKIDKRKMELDDAIRALGYTNVPVKLHHDVTATLRVHVTEEA
ncbi:50S ribosomal protein L9, partial [Streptococcus pneumoniae]|nr:50S ribosomal protein L9 [Streptococcus pneumoniae]